MRRITELPYNTSWQFIDKGYQFSNIVDPWETPSSTPFYGSSVSDTLTEDFVAIKVGDLNNTVFDLETPEDQLFFSTPDINMVAGESYTLDFKSSNFNSITLYQFALLFDETAIEVINYDSSTIIQNDYERVAPNIVTAISENISISGLSVGENTTLFSINIKALKDVQLSEVISLENALFEGLAVSYKLNSSGLVPGVSDFKVLEIELDFPSTTPTPVNEIAKSNLILHQNQPNPFSHTTTISFELPVADNASFDIFDANGRLVKSIDGFYQKGLNYIQIHQDDLPSKGLFYYQLTTNNYSSSKRMLVL